MFRRMYYSAILLSRSRWLVLIPILLVLLWSVGDGAMPVSADPVGSAGQIKLTGAAADRFSPPTMVDLNGDGRQEILVGTDDGKIYAIQYTSTGNHLAVLWSHDASVDTGCATSVSGGISAADLNGDGKIKVIVPLGKALSNACGGLLVLDGQTGATQWLFRTFDIMTNATDTPTPDGIPDPVLGTPALGDLDNDGKLEIVFGDIGQHVYALRSDGTTVPGWPKFVRDATWSSPALADIDNDGFLEVIIGIDTHQEGAPFNTQNGGRLFVFRWDGTLEPGWPQFIGQNISSSPAVGDLYGNGNLEIVSGTGEDFTNPTAGDKVYVWDKSGNLLWSASTGGYVFSSPALARLDNSGTLKVIAGAEDGKLYAWNSSGSLFWSTTPKNFQGKIASPTHSSPVVADYNNDGVPDIFINIYWDAAVLNGTNGTQLTATSFPNNPLPAYTSGCTVSDNAPAIGDIDGDGKLELVLASGDNSGANCGTGQVDFWRLNVNVPSDPKNPTTAPWTMFGQSARHTHQYPQQLALDSEVVSRTLPSIMAPGQQKQVSITFRNTGSSSWKDTDPIQLGEVNGSDPFTSTIWVSLNPGETIAPGQTKTFTFTLQAPTTPGFYTTEWRLINRTTGKWFGRTALSQIKVGSQPAIHVLTTQGMYAAGSATTPFTPPTGFWNWVAADVWKLTNDKSGYYMLDSAGGYWYGGDAVPLYAPPAAANVRDIVLGRNDFSYYELLGDGTIHGCDSMGCSLTFSPAIPTGIVARSMALTLDGKGVYVVDGYGNIYRGGNAPAISLPSGFPLSSDIIRRIKFTSDGTGYYMMDMYGRIWNGGTAPVMTLGYTPQIGTDWARDFELTEDGTGFYLLSENDVIYSGGTAEPLMINLPPTSTGDIGRDLELIDGRNLPRLQVSNQTITLTHAVGTSNPIQTTVSVINTGPGQISWTATSSAPSALALSPNNGNITFGTPAQMQITINNPASYGLGQYNFTINVAGTSTAPVQTTPQVISVILKVVNPTQLYLPLVIR